MQVPMSDTQWGQTETLGFGVEKGLLECRVRTPNNPRLPEGFQQSIFRGQVGGCCRVCDQLVYNSLIVDVEVTGHYHSFSSVQSLSHVWLCDPMNCSTPGLPVHHQLPEFTQTHVHWVSDAIQTSHPLSSLSPAFNLSQHQGLFKWVNSSHQMAKVLEFQLQQSVLPMNTQDWSPLGWTGWIFLQSKGLSRIFSNTTVQKHQFLGAQLSL